MIWATFSSSCGEADFAAAGDAAAAEARPPTEGDLACSERREEVGLLAVDVAAVVVEDRVGFSLGLLRS